VKTLASQEKVKINENESISMDPALLFQRLIAAASHRQVDLEKALHYELSAFPTSLFESSTVLRKSQKSQIAYCITEHCKLANHETTPTELGEQTGIYGGTVNDTLTKFVMDGGSLLHRLAWKRGETYLNFSKSYAVFTVKNYGKATVVFDGYYNIPTIKDCTHRRRRMNLNLIPTVNFSPQTIFCWQERNISYEQCE